VVGEDTVSVVLIPPTPFAMYSLVPPRTIVGVARFVVLKKKDELLVLVPAALEYVKYTGPDACS
jgi:hypothetical protein